MDKVIKIKKEVSNLLENRKKEIIYNNIKIDIIEDSEKNILLFLKKKDG